MKKLGVSLISVLIGFMCGSVLFVKIEKKVRRKVQIMSDKHLALFLMMEQWVHVKQDGKSISDYLSKMDVKNIAIYGMSYAGERLLYELKGTSISVKYGIDKKADEIYSEIDIVSPNENLESVDAVIVTSIFYMDEIKKVLSQKLSCPIISLEDILNEI